MGYVEILLGHLVRDRLVNRRVEEWRARLEADHRLSPDELDTLAPYLEYVSRYGSRTELVLLVLAFSPFLVILLGIAGFSLLSGIASVGAGLGGDLARPSALYAMGAIFALMTVFAVVLLGLAGHFLWRRWKRYRLASRIKSHLTTDPPRLCGPGDPLPKSREEIAKTIGADTSDGQHAGRSRG